MNGKEMRIRNEHTIELIAEAQKVKMYLKEGLGYLDDNDYTLYLLKLFMRIGEEVADNAVLMLKEQENAERADIH